MTICQNIKSFPVLCYAENFMICWILENKFNIDNLFYYIYGTSG